jgi:hypothetical protein
VPRDVHGIAGLPILVPINWREEYGPARTRRTEVCDGQRTTDLAARRELNRTLSQPVRPCCDEGVRSSADAGSKSRTHLSHQVRPRSRQARHRCSRTGRPGICLRTVGHLRPGFVSPHEEHVICKSLVPSAPAVGVPLPGWVASRRSRGNVVAYRF